MALGAYQALLAAGQADRVKVFGFDGSDDALKSISEGKLAATAMQYPKLMASTAIEYAERYLKGERNLPAKVPVNVDLVTKANVEKFGNYGLIEANSRRWLRCWSRSAGGRVVSHAVSAVSCSSPDVARRASRAGLPPDSMRLRPPGKCGSRKFQRPAHEPSMRMNSSPRLLPIPMPPRASGGAPASAEKFYFFVRGTGRVSRDPFGRSETEYR